MQRSRCHSRNLDSRPRQVHKPRESHRNEWKCFTIEADNQYQADEKAYRFLANLQKKHDLAYEKLLDEQGIRFRKREEIIERRLIYLRDLRRPGDPDSFGSQKDPKV